MLFRYGVRRTLAALGAAGVLAVAGLGAAGCGGSGSSSSTAGSAGHKPVTLTLAWWYDGTSGAFKQIVDGFHAKYPWITVQAQTVPFADYFQKVGAWVSAKNGPDVIAMNAGGQAAPYYSSLRPIDQRAFRSDLASVTSPDGFCPSYDCSKGLYGVTFSRQGQVLYYNKDVLKAAGLDPAHPPTTLTEMASACPAVEKIGKACWIVGGKDFGLPLVLGQMALRTATVEQMKALAAGRAKWTDPEFEQALALTQKIGTSGWYQGGFVTQSIIDQAAPFEAGKSAFLVGLMGDGNNWKVLGDAMGYDKVGVMNFPTVSGADLPGVRPGPLNDLLGVSGASGLVIPRWSKHPKEAELLLHYTLDPSVQQAMVAQQGGPFPAIKGAQAGWSSEPIFGDLVQLANASKSGSLVDYIGFNYVTALNAQLQQLSLGKTTVAQAAAQLQKAADAATKGS